MRKVIVITGARRGLGYTLANLFASLNYDLVINDKEDEELLNKIGIDLKEKYKVEVLVNFSDISIESNVLMLLEDIKKKYNRVDVLVNNAAIVTDLDLVDRPTELFNETIRNNVTSVYLMCKYIGRFMFENKKGKIINMSSTNGINSFFPTSIDYDASKSAVISLTHNFAVEYAPYVLVNSIAPGWINTDMNKQLPKEVIEEETSKIYLKRFAEPLEIAKFISFLASDDCSYLNGEIIKLDGGY